MDTLGGRLKLVRQQRNLTQTALGEFIGVSKQAVANVESSHSNPSIDFLCKLIENLNLNINWLLTGRGAMFNENFNEFEILKDRILIEVKKMLISEGLLK